MKFLYLISFTCLQLPLGIASSAALPNPSEPHVNQKLVSLKATYNLRAHGFTAAKSELELRVTDDRLLYRMTAVPTGLATLFTDSVEIDARMHLEQDRIVAEEYKKNYLRNKDKKQHYVFDHSRSIVKMLHKGENYSLKAPSETLDEASMQLQLMLDVQHHDGPWHYNVASNGKIKRYRFTEIGNERIDSAFGKIRTVKIQRTKLHAGGEDAVDYYYWLSPAHQYLPIRAEKLEDGKIKRILSARIITFD